MVYLTAGFVALLVGLMLLHALSRANPATLAKVVQGILGVAILGAAALLGARGGLAIAIPLATFGLWLLSNALPSGPQQTASSCGNRTSQVETSTLSMELDLDTGDVNGRVKSGPFAGRDLADLSPAEIVQVWEACRYNDPQSAQILEAYLDRRHPDWRDDMARAAGGESQGADTSGSGRQQSGSGGRTSSAGGSMSEDDAFEVLGLDRNATREDIIRAHRELITKVHPDRGGSSYLAAQINRAKEVLLSRRAA